LEKTVEGLSDTIIQIVDKLAGKESNLKLSFEDLTLDMGMVKSRVNGSIVFDIIYAQQANSVESKPEIM
jgi:hypothetical protein